MQRPVHPVQCPICGHVDRIEKVSAIVAAGTTTGKYSGSSLGMASMVGGRGVGVVSAHTTLSGMSQTHLGQKLSPPPQPRYESGITAGCILAFVLISIFVGIPGAYFVLIFSSVLLMSTHQPLVVLGILTPQGTLTASSLTTLLIGGGTLVLLLLWLILGAPARRARKAARAAKRADEQARWHLAMQRWSQLYYCYRDDIVFAMDNPKTFVPPQNIMTLL